MLRKDIEENFPFISVVTYGQKEFVGIINNQDNFVTSMYVYTDLMEDAENSKDVKVVMGPTVNLNNLSVKRVKRKSVQLIRKPKP